MHNTQRPNDWESYVSFIDILRSILIYSVVYNRNNYFVVGLTFFCYSICLMKWVWNSSNSIYSSRNRSVFFCPSDIQSSTPRFRADSLFSNNSIRSAGISDRSEAGSLSCVFGIVSLRYCATGMIIFSRYCTSAKKTRTYIPCRAYTSIYFISSC